MKSGILPYPRENVGLMRVHLQTLSDLIKTAGIESKPWVNSELPLFSMVEPSLQLQSINGIERAIELLQSSLVEGHSLLDTRQLLWRSLRRFGWTPNSDVFDYISEEDTVEVYSLDQIQTFRNLQFFRFVSFTLEQIHSRPWFELTRRDSEYEKALGDEAARLISGGHRETIDLSYIPVHRIEEIGSQELRCFTLEMRCMSPVFYDGVIAAIIAVNRTRHSA